MLASIAEFERDLIRDRVMAGLRRAKAQGRRLGRPRQHRFDADEARELVAGGLSLRAVARQLGTHPYLVSRAVNNPSPRRPLEAAQNAGAARPAKPVTNELIVDTVEVGA